MKDFIIIDTDLNEEFEGQFDDKGSEEYPYVIFNYNGMIGIKNPSNLDSKILNHLLMQNKNEEIIKYNNFIIKIK